MTTPPPSKDGCPIFDADGNVLTDEAGRVVTNGFRQRSAVSTQINGSLLHGYVATNFKIWQVIASWFLRLAAIVATTYTTVVWIAAPHFRESIREIDAPIEARLTLGEKRMDKHELEVAQRSLDYLTKDEIQREINKLQIEIENLRDRVDRFSR